MLPFPIRLLGVADVTSAASATPSRRSSSPSTECTRCFLIPTGSAARTSRSDRPATVGCASSSSGSARRPSGPPSVAARPGQLVLRNCPCFRQELRLSGLSASRAARREPGKGYDVARGRRVPHDAQPRPGRVPCHGGRWGARPLPRRGGTTVLRFLGGSLTVRSVFAVRRSIRPMRGIPPSSLSQLAWAHAQGFDPE